MAEPALGTPPTPEHRSPGRPPPWLYIYCISSKTPCKPRSPAWVGSALSVGDPGSPAGVQEQQGLRQASFKLQLIPPLLWQTTELAGGNLPALLCAWGSGLRRAWPPEHRNGGGMGVLRALQGPGYGAGQRNLSKDIIATHCGVCSRQ